MVDDGSTDDTPEILRGYLCRHRGIRVFKKENGGTASALNRGLIEARGKWICWLSSDDMFDVRKLEIHRREIERHSNVDFFFSYFRLLSERTGELADHELWGPLPEPEFYLVGLFYRNFINGVTICVRRDSFEKAGFFDEDLKYAQDYDMWLRLLSVSSGAFIPEWTVISRNHASQGSEIFPQACIYDTAKAAIRFINNTPFEGFFPRIDLIGKGEAARSLRRVLDIAADPSSFVYWLGPHPALLLRTAEWIDRKGENRYESRKELEALLQKKASGVKKKGKADRFSFMWKVMAATRQIGCASSYDAVSSGSVGETCYYSIPSMQVSEAEPLRKYLELYEDIAINDSQPRTMGREIVFVMPTDVSDKGILGGITLDPVLAAAKCLVKAGMSVMLLGLGRHSMRYCEGMFIVSVSDLKTQRRLLSLLKPLDVIVTFGDHERAVPPSRVRIICDPSTISLRVNGKRGGTCRLQAGLSGDRNFATEEFRDLGGQLLEMMHNKGEERQGRSRLIAAYNYVRGKTAALLLR